MNDKYAELVGALIGLARTTVNYDHSDELTDTILTGLAIGRNALDNNIEELTKRAHDQKYDYAPNCRYCANPCERTSDFDMRLLSDNPPKVYELKMQILDILCWRAMQMKEGKIQTSLMLLMEGLTYIGESMPEMQLLEFVTKYSRNV